MPVAFSHSKSVWYDTFVWACQALNSPKQLVPAWAARNMYRTAPKGALFKGSNYTGFLAPCSAEKKDAVRGGGQHCHFASPRTLLYREHLRPCLCCVDAD